MDKGFILLIHIILQIKEEYVIATTEHGIEINALITKENIYGFNFI